MTALRKMTLAELDKAPTFTVIWDKYGVKYFKLADGGWSSETLEVFDSAIVAMRNVRIYTR